MLTERKQRYAQARAEGKNILDSALYAGCPKKSARQAGSRYEKDKEVIAEIEAIKSGRYSEKEENKNTEIPQSDDPKNFLVNLMNDPSVDIVDRKDAAKTLMPYFHGKLGEKGKKLQKQEEAQKASKTGKFRIRKGPMTLVSSD